MKKIFTSITMAVIMLMASQTVAQETNNQLGPIDSFGFLNAPNGETWTYTAKFTKGNILCDGITFYDMYTSVNLEIYDSNKQLLGTIVDSLKTSNPNEVGVKDLEITNFVTNKFFNFDANTELVLMIVYNTKQYQNKVVSRVYSIAKNTTSTQPVCEIPGNMVLSKNIGEFNENYTAIFNRDSIQTTSNMQHYDVYTKASYSSPNAPELKHTFSVPYDNIKALNDLFPVFLVKNGAFVNYVMTQYEKPYFVETGSYEEEPEITPDNNLIITYLNQKFDTVYTTKIPIVQDSNEKLLYTYPMLGGLGFENDIILNYNGGDEPVYVITLDKYNLENDGSIYSYYIYDVYGKKIGTIAENVLSKTKMTPISGYEEQWMFIKQEYDGEFLFVNIPSCTVESEISIYLEDGKAISQKIDRYPVGDSYQYVVALLQGDQLEDGNVVQKMAWLNKDGSFDRYEEINLGKRIEAADVFVSAYTLNPMLFNTDAAREYMVLVKRYDEENTNDKETALLICSTEGEILLDCGEDSNKGEIIMLDLLYMANQYQLLLVYENAQHQYTLDFIPLPLVDNPLKGSGTTEDPYLIESMADFMKIEKAPSAYYLVGKDVDFMSVPFAGIKTTFTGVLDGDNHQFRNVNLDGSGLFAAITDSAIVKNLTLYAPIMRLGEVSTPAGLLVNTIQGSMSGEDGSMETETVSAILKNIKLISPKVVGDNYKGIFGTIAGNASLFVKITECLVTDAKISLPMADGVGGLAGQLATASAIKASAFDGIIEAAKMVAGAVATAGSGETIKDVHVNAELIGSEQIGGIIAYSQRTPINNCYVQGKLILTEDAIVGKIGGIVGELQNNEVQDSVLVLNNCLVGVQQIILPNGLDSLYVHRVAGFTAGDKYNYFEQKYETPEPNIKACFVVSDLKPIDEAIQLTDTTTEGENIAWENITEEWLTEHGFAIGNDVNAPWKLDEGLTIWFEEDNKTAIDNVIIDESTIAIDNDCLIGKGYLEIYNIGGTRVKAGYQSLSIADLMRGVYIIRLSNGEDNKVTKVLIP